MTLRITIISYNWPPRNAIGTHRPYSWARHWNEAGAQITVLTAKKYAFDGPLDSDLATLRGVEVIEIPYISAGWLGSILRIPLLRRWAKRVKTWMSLRTTQPVDIRGGWADAAASVAGDLAQASDVVVSTYGPAAAHIIGARMKKCNNRLLWVADYRDLWSQNTHLPFSESQREAERKIELSTVGSGADLITTVSSELAEQINNLTGKLAVCVENGFDISDDEVAANIYRAPSSNGGPLRIVYTGIVYPVHRDPEPLLRALTDLKKAMQLPEGGVVCEFYGAQVEPVKELARDPNFAQFVRIRGHVPRREALAAQRDADLLLLLESPSADAKGVLTGKLFEYLASGTPILSLGSAPESAICNLLAKTGAGRCAGTNAEAIGDIIAAMRCGQRPNWYRPSITEILKYSRRERASHMLRIIGEQAIIKGRQA